MRHAVSHAREVCSRFFARASAGVLRRLRRLFGDDASSLPRSRGGRFDPGKLSIGRVRLAFASLLFMLLAGVLMLLHSALDRLEQERRLRHEVVAERVFDELERELNAHLERESARPSSAYDAPTSQVGAWAPYVVGYFTVAEDYRVLGGEQLTHARKARIDDALARVWPNPRRSSTQTTAAAEDKDKDSARAGDVSTERSRLGMAKLKRMSSAEVEKTLPSKLSSDKALDNSPEVLRRLNRGQEARQKQAKSQSMQDPFGY